MDPTIIILAAFAGFILYQLYSVLGTRGGHEPEESEEMPVPPAREESTAYDEEPVSPSAKETPEWARPIVEADPAFHAKEFVTGAKAAYEMIIEAFAGDRLGEVKPYLDPGVFRAFESAIKARGDAGQSFELNFVGIESATVTEASVDKGIMRIGVEFRSDQIRVLRNKAGEVVEGDPNRIDAVRDRWTFARSVSSRDPNWILVTTGGAAPEAI